MMACPECEAELVPNGPGLYVCTRCEQLVKEIDARIRRFYHLATGEQVL